HDDPGDRVRRPVDHRRVVLGPARRLRHAVGRHDHRPGPARGVGLRVRAPDGPDEPPARAGRRDGLPHGEGGVLLRLEPARQGARTARRRPHGPGPELGAPAAGGSLLSGTAVRAVTSQLRVRYSETDQMGIVYHAHYLVWFEIGRTEWCRA